MVAKSAVTFMNANHEMSGCQIWPKKVSALPHDIYMACFGYLYVIFFSLAVSLCLPRFVRAISVLSLWYLCDISTIVLQRLLFLPDISVISLRLCFRGSFSFRYLCYISVLSLCYLYDISLLSLWYLRVIYIWYPCELVFWKRRSALLKLENNLAMWPLLFQSLTHLQIWIYRMSLLIPACWI